MGSFERTLKQFLVTGERE